MSSRIDFKTLWPRNGHADSLGVNQNYRSGHLKPVVSRRDVVFDEEFGKEGKPVYLDVSHLANNEIMAMNLGLEEYGMNTFVSDKISPHRRIGKS